MFTLLNLYQRPMFFLTGLIIVVVWELVWRGIGLWYSAQNKQKSWYIAMLVLNTAGLLPIIYLIWFRPKKEKIKIDKTKLERFVEAAKKSAKTAAKQKAAKKKK